MQWIKATIEYTCWDATEYMHFPDDMKLSDIDAEVDAWAESVQEQAGVVKWKVCGPDLRTINKEIQDIQQLIKDHKKMIDEYRSKIIELDKVRDSIMV